MISFSLRCDNGHSFDSWFASNAAFETLVKAGHVACIDCGTAQVRKALMAPAVSTERAARPEVTPDKTPIEAEKNASEVKIPASGAPSLRALAALRKHVEETATYVGNGFAKEVRAIDAGSAPARPLWGEVTRDEARDLLDDGLPVTPLPFGPRQKAN